MKKRESKPAITVIRYSCVTGEAIWLYRGPSKEAARAAYRRACERELTRIRTWIGYVEKRKANIRRLLGTFADEIPFTSCITEEQQKAANLLLSIANEPPQCYCDFYNHIMEERKQHNGNYTQKKKILTFNSKH